jgi:mevalonate pyrophosphate decarboxylase
MGYIKEPEGVDFVINGKPLTDKQKKISEFIKAGKKRISEIKTLRTKSTNRQQGIAKSGV